MTQRIDNPALAPVGFLVGEWTMALSGAAFLSHPDEVVHNRVEFQPIEGDRLLAMRQLIDPAGPPAATWVFGKDENQPEYTVLYVDARGVSRVYSMTLDDGTWKLWRNDPEFAQRFEATISPDGRSMTGKWEKRSSGGDWEHDFNIEYTRD